MQQHAIKLITFNSIDCAEENNVHKQKKMYCHMINHIAAN